MSNQRGMSLIEILITVVIIGIVFSLLFQSTDFFSNAANKHDDKKKATLIAEEQLAKQLDQLKKGATLPERYIVDRYLVTIHTGELSDDTVFPVPDLSHHVSMSSVYDNEGIPEILTITVSWEERM